MQDIILLKYTCLQQIMMFFFFGIIHVLNFRLYRVKNILRVTLLHGLIGGILGIFLTYTYADVGNYPVTVAILNFILYMLAVFSYGSMGPIMADRSVSLFLLFKLAENEKGKGDATYLADLLGGRAMFDKRYREHEDVGALKREGNTLYITDKGRSIARFYLFILNLLKLNKNF